MGRMLGMTAVLFLGCAPSHLLTKHPPEDALDHVVQRLQDQDIILAAEGRRPDRVRSATYCFVGATSEGFSWNRNFAQRRAGPLPFRHIGDEDEHAKRTADCPSLFRFTVLASREGSATRLTVESEWWHLERGSCAPHGHPLVGQLACNYRYRGAPPGAKIESYVYAILKGL